MRGRHQDRGEPLERSPHDGLVRRAPLAVEQVAVVVHQEDPVSHGDPEQRDEPDQAGDREDRRGVLAASEQRRCVLQHLGRLGEEDRQDATDQGQREVDEDEQRDAQRTDGEVQERQHDQEHDAAEEEDRPARGLLRLELAPVLHRVAVAGDDRVHAAAHLVDQVAEVGALIHVQGHDRAPLGVLARDQVRGHLRADVGDLLQPYERASRAAQHEAAQVVHRVALVLSKSYREPVAAHAFVHLGDGHPEDRIAHLARRGERRQPVGGEDGRPVLDGQRLNHHLAVGRHVPRPRQSRELAFDLPRDGA